VLAQYPKEFWSKSDLRRFEHLPLYVTTRSECGSGPGNSGCEVFQLPEREGSQLPPESLRANLE
jgi:hypothetical protein